MAVIITRKDCTLSEANAFYRVESYQVGCLPNTTTVYISLATAKVIPLTFANTGVFKGITLPIYVPAVVNTNRDIKATLQEQTGAATLPVASPGIVTKNAHGFTGNEPISFSTTGVLPTGVTAGVTYYVKYINANTFNISATVGGSNINFTGTPSGTHYLWEERANKTLTYAQMSNGIQGKSTYTAAQQYNYYWVMDINFTGFSADITVDTTANKWRVQVMYAGGTTGTVGLWYNTDSTTYPYYAYCDNQVSFTDNDTVVFAHYCDIDTSATFGGLLGVGDTTYGISSVICSNINSTGNDDVGFLRCLTPAASYTLTLKGYMIMNHRSGFKVGTSTSRISASNRFILTFGTPTVGTAVPRIAGYSGLSSVTYYRAARQSLNMYGEYPTICAFLSANANTGQAVINVTGDITGWSNGDTIVIGKEDAAAVGEYKKYTIQSISGQEITLTGNLTSQNRITGGMVINLTPAKYGINIINSNATAAGIQLLAPNSLILDGVYNLNCYAILASVATTNVHYMDDTDAYVTATNLKNTASESSQTTSYIYCIASSRINRLGTYFENWWGYRFQLNYPSAASTGWSYNKIYKSGIVSMINVGMMNSYGVFPGVNAEKCYIDGFYNQNQRSSYGLWIVGKAGSIIKNVYLWYLGLTIGDGATVDTYFDNVHADKYYGVVITAAAVVIGTTFNNFSIGQEAANTYDYAVTDGAYINILAKDCVGFNTKLSTFTDYTNTITGSYLAFSNKEDVANDDLVETTNGNLKRCGTGLTDTTVLGTNNYSLRFEQIGAEDLEWEQNIPTGNIQNKTMAVTCKVKINSANYYAGTDYNLPRLTITYDDGTDVYAEAEENTNEQTLVVSFIPLTTFPQITVKVSGMTDATESDAYFYVGDAQVLYPAGVQVNTGDFSLWSEAMPVTPWIATNVNAADVWAYQTSSLTVTGSIGKDMNKVQKAHFNRMKVENNKLNLYDDDGTTIIYTWDLYNAVGTPTSTGVTERAPE